MEDDIPEVDDAQCDGAPLGCEEAANYKPEVQVTSECFFLS